MPHAHNLPLPSYQTADAAGMDLIAAVPPEQPLILMPGDFAKVPTGLVIELPTGTEGQIRPRSGLAAKHGITVLNAPGTIDADYRGEVAVILINHGRQPFSVVRGERIAQIVVAPVAQLGILQTETVSATARGSGGFGSTGSKTAVKKHPATRQRKKKSVPQIGQKRKQSPTKGRGR